MVLASRFYLLHAVVKKGTTWKVGDQLQRKAISFLLNNNVVYSMKIMYHRIFFPLSFAHDLAKLLRRIKNIRRRNVYQNITNNSPSNIL